MNKGIVGAIVGVVIVAAVAVGAYFVFFAGPGGSGPSVTGTSLPGGMTAKQAADKLVASATNQGRTMAYAAAESDGSTLVMKDVTIKMPGNQAPLKIGEMRLKKYDYDNTDMPKYADVEYRKLSLGPFMQTQQGKQFMQMLGVEDILVDVHAAYTYDDTNKVLDVTKLVIDSDKLAEISLTMKLGGIDLAKMQEAQKGGKPDPAAMMGMMQTLQIYNFTLSIKDDGVRDAILKSVAKQQNSEADKIKTQIVAMMTALKASAQAKAQIAQEALTAAIATIQDGGTITIKIAPEQAVAVMSLAPTFMGGPTPEKLDALKKQLNLSITHN